MLSDPVVDRLNRTPFRGFIPLFSSLNPVDPQTLIGRYAAVFTGPAWLRKTAQPSLSLLHFKGWCGKNFSGDGIHGTNLFRRVIILERYPFTTHLVESIIDRRASLVVQYCQGSPFPWMHIIDELRRYDDKYILGMTVLKSRRFPLLPFPFLLYPWENNHAI